MRKHPSPPQINLIIPVLFALASLSCQVPALIISRYFPSSTPTHFPTFTHTLSPSATSTHTPTPSPTFTRTPTTSSTPTITPTYTPTSSYTPTRTSTPISPTWTPAPGQITAGQASWTLQNLQMTHWLYLLGKWLTPSMYNGAPLWYDFLKVNFTCDTGRTLISLLSPNAEGLTFVHQRHGYANITLTDSQSRIYRVNIIGDCWLAAVVRPDSYGFILRFLHLNPLELSGD